MEKLAPAIPFVFFSLVISGFISAIVRRRRISGPTSTWPFYAKRVLTPPEQVLYQRLVKALPNHIVLAQVQLSRVLGVKRGFKFHEWNNRINRMSYDFVICDSASTVVAAIELDDKSHEKEHRIIADAKKTKATTDAGIRLVRWNVKSLPNEEGIRQSIAALQAGGPTTA